MTSYILVLMYKFDLCNAVGMYSDLYVVLISCYTFEPQSLKFLLICDSCLLVSLLAFVVFPLSSPKEKDDFSALLLKYLQPNLNMNITALPDEIFVEIFSYLELKDVLSCCLVCKSWRNALNANGIWFNLCSQRWTVSKNSFELIQAPSVVDPVFVPPTSPTLPEVCLWRLRFMQEAHLSRNWRFGRFAAYPVTKMFGLDFICGDDDAVNLTKDEEGFSRYNIKSIPKLVQKTRYSLRNVDVNFFKLAGRKLVVRQGTLLQVFSKTVSNDKKFELSHRFLFDKSESASNNIPNSPDITKWYNNNKGLYSSYINICDHNGDYFVGLVWKGNLNKAILHIWDLNTRHKTVEILVPDVTYSVANIEFSIHSSNVYIVMATKFNFLTIIRCLSLNTLKYTDLNIEFTCLVPNGLVCDKFLLYLDDSGKNVCIWRRNSGSFVHKLSCDFVIFTLEFESDLVIVAGNNFSEHTGTVKVFNTNSLKYACEFSTDYNIRNLFFISSGLILVCGRTRLEIWDTASVTKVQKLQYDECFWISPTKTKILVKDDDCKLILLHFW